MRNRLAWVLALLLAAACAGAPTGHHVKFRADAPRSAHDVPYAPAVVRAALPLVYQDLGFPGAWLELGTGWEFTTPQLRVDDQLYGRQNSDFIDCGVRDPSARLENTGDLILAMQTRLEPGSGGGTRVRTQLDAHVRRRDGMAFVYCPSRGVLEDAIAQALILRLATGGA